VSKLEKKNMKRILAEPLSKTSEILKKDATETTEDSSERAGDMQAENEVYSKTTLFVSTLPFEATKEQVEEFFSEIGPIRSCFIVKKNGKSAGCGYVQYALPEDTDRALELLKKKRFHDKRTLKIVRALRKKVALERKETGIPLQELEYKKVKQKVKVAPATPGSGDSSRRLVNSVTVQVSNLPPAINKKVMYKKARKFGTVMDIILEDNSAKIVYETPEMTKKAQKQLHDHVFKGVRLVAAIVETITPQSIAKKSRIIVRNLSFHCRAENLKTVFEPFGDLVDVQVPKTSDGKQRGFGFVQFKELDSAQKAIDAVNGQKVLGRLVAVDWALGKAEYDRLNSQEMGNADAEGKVGEETNEETPGIDSAATEEDNLEMHDEKEGSEKDEGEQVTSAPAQAIKREEFPEECTLFIRNLSFETTKDTLHKK
jgi:nucleolar protein 4